MLLPFLLLLTLALIVGGALTLGQWIELRKHQGILGLSLATGLALWGSLHFVLGLFGWISGWSLGILLLVLGGWGLWQHRNQLLDFRSPWAWLALPPLILCLYPSVAFDATLYHLPYAEAFYQGGDLPFMGELRYPVFPQLGELLFLPGWSWLGAGAARLSQALAFLATAIILFEGIREKSDPADGKLAAALWLGTPLALWLGSVAYVDATLTLFVCAGFAVLGRPTLPRRSLLAGILFGAAAGVKYLGLFFGGVAGIWFLVESWRRRSIRPTVTYSVVGAAVAGPWYLRNFWLTGNPLFPFYPKLFGENPWVVNYGSSSLGESGASLGSSLGEALVFLVRTPWSSWMDREVFHWAPPIHPLWLILPLFVVLWLGRRSTRPWALLLLFYGAFWLTAGRDLRYLLPILPLLCYFSAAELNHWFQDTRIRGAFIVFALAPSLLWAGYRLYRQGPPPLSTKARQAYVVSIRPGAAALFSLEGEKDKTVYGLYGEHLSFFAPGRYLGDLFGPYAFSRLEKASSRGEAHRELKTMEADYLLVLRKESRPFEDWKRVEGLELLAEEQLWLLFRVQ